MRQNCGPRAVGEAVRPKAVGHLSVQVARWPRPHGNITLRGIAGWPSRQCPIVHGCRGHRLRGFKRISNYSTQYTLERFGPGFNAMKNPEEIPARFVYG
jgi:hypothetical protein